jgi:hypothetical protein
VISALDQLPLLLSSPVVQRLGTDSLAIIVSTTVALAGVLCENLDLCWMGTAVQQVLLHMCYHTRLWGISHLSIAY